MDFTIIQPQIEELAKKHNLDFVVLFGSQATGRTHEKSDIDLAVISKSNFDITSVTMDLYNVFKRDDVEVVNLGLASPTLMHAVVRDGKLLYEREERMFFKWKLYAIKIWMETKWLRDLRAKKLLQWADNNKTIV